MEHSARRRRDPPLQPSSASPRRVVAGPWRPGPTAARAAPRPRRRGRTAPPVTNGTVPASPAPSAVRAEGEQGRAPVGDVWRTASISAARRGSPRWLRRCWRLQQERCAAPTRRRSSCADPPGDAPRPDQRAAAWRCRGSAGGAAAVGRASRTSAPGTDPPVRRPAPRRALRRAARTPGPRYAGCRRTLRVDSHPAPPPSS